jgi:predicted permease
MSWLKKLLFRVRTDEIDKELRFHVDQQIEDNINAGMSPKEARYAALRAFGGMEQTKEQCRDIQRTRFIEEFWQDLRYGLRMLRRSPVFTAVAILSLALGIGANTAIFSLIDAVLLRMLPVENPSELVVLSQQVESEQVLPFATPHYRGLREGGEVLSGLCAFRPWPGVRVDINGESDLAFGQLVSGNYYSLLGVHALMGRTLSDYDDKASQPPVAVISYAYWQRRFGSDPNIVGRPIELQGQPFTIVGVTPRDFFGTEAGQAVEITAPLAMHPVVLPGLTHLIERRGGWLMLLGRLMPDVSEDQARARLNVLWAQLLAAESPGKGRRHPTLELQPGAQGLNRLRERFSLPLRILMSAVGLLLLIACANLASLLLARSMTRRHEIEVRLAVGAGRGRVVRQLLTESVLLSVIGGIAGAALAFWVTDLMLSMMSQGNTPIVLSVAPDSRALAFTCIVSILTGLLFGVLPALRVTKGEIQSGLKGSARGVVGARNRWAESMVILQVALSLLLLSSAALFMRTLHNLHIVDAGFRKDHVLLLSVRPGASGYRGARASALCKELYTRFSSAPGVQAVTFSMDTPLGGLSYAAGLSVPGRPAKNDDKSQVYFNNVGPRFFETLGIPIVSGRDFNDHDGERALEAAIISESLAKEYFPDENPLGRQVLAGGKSVEIVGVARDTRYEGLRQPGQQMIYTYFQGSGGIGELTFCIRTAGNPLNLVPLLRRETRAVAQNLPLHSVSTLEQRVDGALVRERMLATLSSFFGVLAVVLASVGLYGTLAYAVVQRTREIGVRMALGAKPGAVLRLVFSAAMRLIFSGLALGIPLAWVAARLGSSLVSGLLFGLKPTDPLAIALATLLLLAVAGLAGYLPARRASKVDPMVALRYE